MKYRRLTNDELNELESEFVRFLASNKITADDWEKLKEDNLAKVENLIGEFSELVFDKILEKVEFMLLKKSRDLRTYKFVEDRILLIGLVNNGDKDGNSELDFTSSNTPQEMMEQMRRTNSEIQLYSAERKFRTDKKLEAFELMEQGALISKDGTMYEILYNLRASQLN